MKKKPKPTRKKNPMGRLPTMPRVVVRRTVCPASGEQPASLGRSEFCLNGTGVNATRALNSL